MQETLLQLGKQDEYAEIMSKISANVSLISAVVIISLPFLTSIDILLPFKVSLIFELLGLWAVISLVNPHQVKRVRKEEKPILTLIKEAKHARLFSIVIFTGAIASFSGAATVYRAVVLESYGLPIILLGLAMGLSRVIWFCLGHTVKWWSRYFNFKSVLLFQFIISVLFLFSFVFISNPYVLTGIIAIVVAINSAVRPIVAGYILKEYIHDDRYKATLFSIKGQITMLFQTPLLFGIGFVMNYSYQLGFVVLGLGLLMIATPTYFIIRKH